MQTVILKPSIEITDLNNTTPRALSLRNLVLVSGYECGRVFPAGVGPGSPSRDAANWLLSRFGLSVETPTRRQHGWLRMVFSGVLVVSIIVAIRQDKDNFQNSNQPPTKRRKRSRSSALI